MYYSKCKPFGLAVVLLIWVFVGFLCVAEAENYSEEDLDGGFSSLDSMLQWSIGHSDPTKLGEAAQEAQRLTAEELEIRRIQIKILELGVIPKLMRMVKSSCSEEAVKALYAVSAVIRNNPDGQAVFYVEGGALMLQDIMSNSSADIRLRRKSVFLVADLADHHLEIGGPVPSFQADKEYLKSVVDLIPVPDLDTQEKALVAIKSLLQLDTNVQILKDFCHLELALERLRHQLVSLVLDENLGDFARDMEAQRQEVESILHMKTKER